MKLPKIKNNNINSFFDRDEIVQQTADQIMKDFGMFGVEISFSGKIDNAYEELHRQLVNQVEHLIKFNYDKLLSVLYQVDITDRQIRQAEQEVPHYSHVEVIAYQIIVRDLKKVLLRRYFKSGK